MKEERRGTPFGWLVCCLFPCALLALSGCENDYPENLKYPLRTDPVVDAGPGFVPEDLGAVKLDRPGDFNRPGQPLSWLLANLPAEEIERKIFYASSLDADQRQQLETTLEEMFGTPRHPKVSGFEGEEEFRQALHVDEATLAEGSSLYRIHCLQCHGLTGNGRGPTSRWVNPHPRDYRLGKFKFMSVKADPNSTSGGNERKPRREDLKRTLREGIEGTSMPSFGLLEDSDLDALASYVIHLSIRGQAEFWVLRDILKKEIPVDNPAEHLREVTAAIAGWWKAADENVINPEVPVPPHEGEALRQSVRKGYDLFRTGGASCLSCHIDYGRQATYFYDVWGTVGRPADLTTGVYRGGRRPIDLYYRIHSGINGSNMPAAGKQNKDEPGGLTSAQIWDLVNFLQVLPYPATRKTYGITITD